MRVKANFVSGTVAEAPLSNVATALTMTGRLLKLPTIGGGDIAVLVIDPDGTDSLAGSDTEIVHVTSYTTGGGSSTLARAQEGTAAVPHSNGVKIVHVATIQDWANAAALDAANNHFQGNIQADGTLHIAGTASFDGAVNITGVLSTTARITAGGGILVDGPFTQIPAADGAVFAINNAANSATLTSFDTSKPSWGVVTTQNRLPGTEFTSLRAVPASHSQGFGLVGGIGYDWVIGREANSDHLDLLTWNGASLRIRNRFQPDGVNRFEGPDHYFGTAALSQNAFGSMLAVDAPVGSYVTLQAQAPDFDHAHLVLLAQGTGQLFLGDGQGGTWMAFTALSGLSAGQTCVSSFGYKDAGGTIQNAWLRAETAPSAGAHYLVVYPGA